MTMCALCRRNLLAGERYRFWRARDGRASARVICYLCEAVAERDGWLRAPERRPGHENAVGLRGSVRLVA
jgi:hypothetical protein